jgi:multiple sugar transport system ATP-binding protein
VASLTFESVSKTYADGTKAVDDLDLEIPDGEFMVFVGPSGCGKTTALRMLAGLEEVSAGVIRIGSSVVNDVPPRNRDVAMVFQNYALYPHMSVFDNMAFALTVQKTPRAEIDRRVRSTAATIGLEQLLDRKPAALSGGQRQRVAMGRAIVRQPKAFLMDEPLSNLDAKLRVQMRAEIARLQHELDVTTVYVTHDQVEAMTMGDRVAVLRKGELQQVADPRTLYNRPVNLFVAGFIGSPAMNMVEAVVDRSDAGYTIRVGSTSLALEDETLDAHPALARYEGRRLVVGIRPEDLEDCALVPDVPLARRLRGTVQITEALGSELIAHIAIDAVPAFTEDVRELAEDAGDDRAPDELVDATSAILVGRFGARSAVSPGQAIEVAVDTRSLHFFDAETGHAIYDA